MICYICSAAIPCTFNSAKILRFEAWPRGMMWGVPPAVVSTPVRCEIALSRDLNFSVFVSQEDMASVFVFDEQSKLECKLGC